MSRITRRTLIAAAAAAPFLSSAAILRAAEPDLSALPAVSLDRPV